MMQCALERVNYLSTEETTNLALTN